MDGLYLTTESDLHLADYLEQPKFFATKTLVFTTQQEQFTYYVGFHYSNIAFVRESFTNFFDWFNPSKPNLSSIRKVLSRYTATG